MSAGKLAHGLLPEVLTGSDRSRRPPARAHSRVTPVIDAKQTFELIETAILAARETVELAYWDFQPDLQVSRPTVRSTRQVQTWGDLLLDAAHRGVRVRVIFNDFDPDVLREFHGEAWQAYSELVSASLRHGVTDALPPDRLQAMCAWHPLTYTSDNAVARLAIGAERSALVSELNEIAKTAGMSSALFRLSSLPRAWSFVEVLRGEMRFVLRDEPLRPVHVGSYHAKVCVVDSDMAFCGGLDPRTGIVDSSRHDAAPFRHDVACVVEGQCVADIARYFDDRWDAEIEPFEAFVKEANAITPHRPLLRTVLRPSGPRRSTPVRAGTGIAQVLRTHAQRLSDPRRARPDDMRWDHWDSYRALIASAREFIYLENQYLRWPAFADLLIERCRAVPDLQVIIVLPFAPEEATQGGGGDIVTRHGMHLQYGILRRLKDAVKHRLGLFTLVAAQPVVAGVSSPTGSQFGSPLIYVHSKLCIVDDSFAVIGSANLDGLGFFVADELSIGLLHPRQVRNFRLRLWAELLGRAPASLASHPPSEHLAMWFAIAERNAAAEPRRRDGFVVPYDLDRVDRGTESALIPDVLARGLGTETSGPILPVPGRS